MDSTSRVEPASKTVGLVFLTGYAADVIDARFASAPVFTKPFKDAAIDVTLRSFEASAHKPPATRI